jgi:hypothetical protein
VSGAPMSMPQKLQRGVDGPGLAEGRSGPDPGAGGLEVA